MLCALDCVWCVVSLVSPTSPRHQHNHFLPIIVPNLTIVQSVVELTPSSQSVRSHTSPRHYHSQTMRLLKIILSAAIIAATNAQFFNAIRNLFSPVTNLFGGGRFVDDGTQSPQSTGREELFPSDCGRDPQDGTGKLCFPDGLLCQNSEYLVLCNYNQPHLPPLDMAGFS